MTKAQLAELIGERLDYRKQEATAIVETIFAIVTESLKRGEGVKISGFGSLVVRRKRARRGRNPMTGEPVILSSRTVVSFRPSAILKARCNRVATRPI